MKKFNNFITFEGPEGSGKSTVAKVVSQLLLEKGVETALTREPGGTGIQFSEDVRELIMKSGDINTMTELLLFESARSEHIEKFIKPNAESNKIVICDRYMDSSTVYQGIVMGLGKERVEELNLLTVGEWVPGITFIFDVPAEVGLERISSNDRETNRFDAKGIEFHNRVRDSYLELAKGDERFIVIDATKPIEEVAEAVLEEIERRL